MHQDMTGGAIQEPKAMQRAQVLLSRQLPQHRSVVTTKIVDPKDSTLRKQRGAASSALVPRSRTTCGFFDRNRQTRELKMIKNHVNGWIKAVHNYQQLDDLLHLDENEPITLGRVENTTQDRPGVDGACKLANLPYYCRQFGSLKQVCGIDS